jgi:hypothetical protein
METKEGRRAKYSHAHDVTTALAKTVVQGTNQAKKSI